MFEPTTLPNAISGDPFSTAATETIISGAEVPKATTVNPTISGGRPSRSDMATAPRTRNSPPTTSATSPARIRNRSTIIYAAAPESVR